MALVQSSSRPGAVAQCLCGTCEVNLPGAPRWVVYCHCSQCRRALSADYATLCGYNPGEVRVVRGATNLSSYTTGKEERLTCKTCGSKVYARLHHLKQEAVYIDMFTTPNHGADGRISDPRFQPTAHIFYTSGIKDIKDGLPKYVDLPAGFGGSDDTVEEDYHRLKEIVEKKTLETMKGMWSKMFPGRPTPLELEAPNADPSGPSALPLVQPGKLTFVCAAFTAWPVFKTDDVKTQKRSGYEPEAAQLIARKMGMEIDWVFAEWTQFKPLVLKGKVDAHFCGSAITPERKQYYAYTRPYIVVDEQVLVKKGSGITGFTDLAGKKIAAISGSTNYKLAETYVTYGATPVGFDGANDDVLGEMMLALDEGKVDAVIDDDCAFGHLVGEGSKYEIAWTAQTGWKWGAAFRHGNDRVRLAVDKAIAEVIKDGDFEKLWAKWFPHKVCPRELRADQGRL